MKILENKSLFKIFFWCWIVFIIILTVIPWASNPKILTKSGLEFRLDYVGHFGLFFILFIFYYFWKLYLTAEINLKHLTIFIVGSIFFAYLDEYMQGFLPSRKYNIIDFYYNASGIVIGYICYLILNLFRIKK